MKKKILIYMFNLSGGGAERTIVNIVNHLDSDKFDVVLVIGASKGNDYISLINNKIRTIHLDSLRQRNVILKLRKIIRDENPDLLFSTLYMNNIVLLISKMLSFKKVPAIIRETTHRTKAGRSSFFNKLITIIFYNFIAKKVVALSNGVKDDLVKNFKVFSNNVIVIYNPININEIQKLKNEEIYDINIEYYDFVIISAGRLAEEKDYATLLRAIHLVSAKINVKLIIIGKGSYKESLINLSEMLNIGDKVKFLGFKKNPYKYMNISDIFVLTSKWEGFGHVLVEAMATKTPVISTDCESGPNEILENGYNGKLVPVGDYKALADNIELLYNSKELRDKYKMRGNYRSEVYDTSTIIKEYEWVFLSVIS